MVDTFANRLKKALDNSGMSQTQLAEKTKIDKSLISNYLSGNYNAKQDKLTILAEALNTNEVWLMGYDVSKDPNGNQQLEKPVKKHNKSSEEYEILFDKYKDVLTESDKAIIKTIIEQRKKEIDKEIDGEQNN